MYVMVVIGMLVMSATVVSVVIVFIHGIDVTGFIDVIVAAIRIIIPSTISLIESSIVIL